MNRATQESLSKVLNTPASQYPVSGKTVLEYSFQHQELAFASMHVESILHELLPPASLIFDPFFTLNHFSF